MTPLLALAALAFSAVRPQNDLRLYLATAVHYASVNRTAALRAIRQWSPAEITRATAALRREEKRLRSAAKGPDDIGFDTVEAAVLLHGEAGLLSLQEHRLPLAKLHFDAALELLEWARRAAAEARNRATMRRHAFKDRPADPGLELRDDRSAGLLCGPGHRRPDPRLCRDGASIRRQGSL